ncbi:MAG: universal stress protein [Lysobacterales bacterium]|nr:MAG: universal stress protein [Xanthomonadales bacterium]
METSIAQEILGATDFSAAAGNAMARAAQLAQAHHCALRIVHVFNELAWTNVRRMLEESPLEPPPETAMRTLVALADELKSRHRLSTVHVQVQIGRASAEIIAVAHKTRPQLIVIGAQGEGLAKALMLGGTAVKILRGSPCPVLVVRREPERPYRRVVVATDFSESSKRALTQAQALFPQAHHVLMHVYSVMFEGRLRMGGASDDAIARYLLQAGDEARHNMEAFVRGIGAAGRAISTRVEEGHPVVTLVDEARLHATDVLVFAKSGGPALAERLFGSVPESVITHAACDLLLVP